MATGLPGSRGQLSPRRYVVDAFTEQLIDVVLQHLLALPATSATHAARLNVGASQARIGELCFEPTVG